MIDDLTRRGWHNARQLDAHRYAADSEPRDPGYTITVGVPRDHPARRRYARQQARMEAAHG